ncbi:MAG: GTP-binding protein, partial [Staphylococcus equorum]|nr:GTP-binding protein [Staphylococcus equorum]
AETWDIEYGDRNTQFVIIGTDLDTEKIERELDACLLNRHEIEQDWRNLPDPYQWEISKQQ